MNLLTRNIAGSIISSICILSVGALFLPAKNVHAAAVCDPATELVVNGSFETPVVTHPATWDIFPSGTGGTGWNAIWLPSDASTFNGETIPAVPYLEFQRSGHDSWGIPYDGEQYAELDTDWKGPNFPSQPFPASIDMYQDIDTVPGATYTLTFATSPRSDDPDTSDSAANILWNGGNIDTITTAVVNPAHTTWTPHTYTVTATASTTRVEFVDAGHPNALGMFVDKVSLVCASGAGGGGGGGGPVIITPATSTLTVIKLVVNNNGGTGTSSDFTITANGTGISTTTATTSATSITFPGSALGTTFTLVAGAYSVDEVNPGTYSKVLSAGCSGILLGGATNICTITNTDPIPVVAGGGGGGGVGGNPIIIQGGGGSSSGGGGGVTTTNPPTTTGGSTTGTTQPDGGFGVGGGGGIPTGQVLGDATTTVPGMPYTGNGDTLYNIVELAATFAIALGAFSILTFKKQ
ncbi:MAG: hypothetical protein JWO50_66 [Candidatus Kaiserbacteria bacterium]|nr:hypothetical protein [Candidatus Kaiserbacteria bacterium]